MAARRRSCNGRERGKERYVRREREVRRERLTRETHGDDCVGAAHGGGSARRRRRNQRESLEILGFGSE